MGQIAAYFRHAYCVFAAQYLKVKMRQKVANALLLLRHFKRGSNVAPRHGEIHHLNT